MIRFAWVIVALSVAWAAAVRIRLEQSHLQSELYGLDADRLAVRRKLWDQQLRLGELTAPRHIRMLSEGWRLEMVGPGEPIGAERTGIVEGGPQTAQNLLSARTGSGAGDRSTADE